MQNCCPDFNDSCSNVIYQSVDVDLPISLAPDVKVGKLKVKCCGEPVVAFRQSKCGICRCEITITQSLSYKIPVEYSIASNVSDAICECKNKGCYAE